MEEVIIKLYVCGVLWWICSGLVLGINHNLTKVGLWLMVAAGLLNVITW